MRDMQGLVDAILGSDIPRSCVRAKKHVTLGVTCEILCKGRNIEQTMLFSVLLTPSLYGLVTNFMTLRCPVGVAVCNTRDMMPRQS